MFSSNSSQVSTAANYIEDVFSTYLYTGNGSTRAIGNGIQLGAGATSPGWIATLGDALQDVGYSITVDSGGNIYVCGYSDASGTTDFQIAKYNTSGAIQWQRRLGGVGGNNGYSITVDSSGNVYVCGSSSASGTNDFQIAKYDANGSIQWQRRLGSAASDIGNSIAVDSSGNVYVCGYSDASGTYDFQIAKYNTSGVIQWQRRLGSASGDYGLSIAVDSSGNVYVCGYSAASGTDNFQIAKYNTSGVIQWQRRLGGTPSGDYGQSIAVDSSGNVYVCGQSLASGSADFQIAKYNTSGVIQWQRRLGGAAGDSSNSIAVDSSGNVYVCGYSSISGVGDFQIAKYNTSGVIQWQRRLGGAGGDIGNSIAVDSSGNIYVCGYSAVSGVENFLFAKLPGDGSGEGVYTVGSVSYTYIASSLTDAASTLTDAASTLTDAASSLTDTASTLTDAASTLTSSTTPLVEGVGKGGLVWLKGRSGATDHALYDTARGATFDLVSNSTVAQTTQSTGLTSFNGNGFTIGSLAKINTNAATYASWTFRKQAKFFDVVTYTGDGTSNRNISHNLGSTPGCVIVKCTSSAGFWAVWHRGGPQTNGQYACFLNSTGAYQDQGAPSYWGTTLSMTSTTFSVGANSDVNANGSTYVAYLFAHDAGGFGASGSDNVISCGSFTLSAGNATVDLGWEPQYVLWKPSSTTGQWTILDIMRGFTSEYRADLYANLSNAEATSTTPFLKLTSTGFTANPGAFGTGNNNTYIYIAIRRGPMKTPTSGTSVFGLSARSGTGANATVTGGQTDDVVFIKNRGSAVASLFSSRLTGTGYLVTSSTAAEVAAGTTILQANPWDVMDGVKVGTTSTITNASANTFINYLFRRAPGFFDVVCYTGTGATGQTISHNLTVAPEFIITKNRTGTANNWYCYQASLASPLDKSPALNTNSSVGTNSDAWRNITSTSFQIGSGLAGIANENSSTYVAYLFATVAGVSKVGSYTGTAALQTIDCGFSAGARFVLIKRTDSTGDWYVWDSARGISSGNDPYLLLNSTAAEVTGTNYVDTTSVGFQVTAAAPAGINASGGSYLFLAVS